MRGDTGHIVLRVDAETVIEAHQWAKISSLRASLAKGPRCRPEKMAGAEIGSKKGTVYV